MHTDKLPRACSGVFLLSHVSTFVLHQPVIRRLSGGRVRHPRHHQTAERRRCAGPLQCDVIDDTIKLLNDGAALELFVCNIMALAAVVSCVRKTHIGCILVFLLTLFTTMRLLRRFPPGGLLFGGRMAAPPGRHRPGLLRRRRAARAARSSLLQAQGVGTRSQDTRHLSSFFLSVSSDTPGREGACCARAGLRSGWAALLSRSVYIIAAGHLLGSSQDTHTINSLSHVCLAMHCHEGCVFSPLHGCLVLYFAGHACSFWFWIVVLVRVYFACKSCGTRCDCRVITPSVSACAFEWCSVGFCFVQLCSSRGSFRVPLRWPPLLLRASSLYSSLGVSCSGERRLFLSLRRRNHLVSDVD